MLLSRKPDFKILLSVFSTSSNEAVLGIFVKELISYLYNALMNLEVMGVNIIMNTKGYADLLLRFVQTLEEIDRQEYAQKFGIVKLLCTLNPKDLPPKGTEMYTPLQLVILSKHEKKLELIEKIITHNVNQSEIQDLVYLCLADTHKHSHVDERKRIITNILRNHPSLYRNQPKHYPHLAPNIHVDLIIHVINLGVDICVTNEKNENLLHRCAEYLKPEEYHRVVNALVERQETELFHSRDEDLNTPLHVAVEHLELLDSTIQLFSSAKVNFNAVNKFNNTGLHRAVLNKRSERILDSLIKAGADENARGQFNNTVLHTAASYGNLTALKYFILRGHDVNVTDEKVFTPLHLAVALSETNTHDMVMLLVEHGADVNAIDQFGTTPLSIANRGQSKVETRTMEYLESIIKQDAESRFIKCHVPIIRKNRDKLIAVTNFESGLLQKLITGGILTEPELEELISIETGALRGNKFYIMLLTKKPDFKILLNAFSDSNNRAVLSIFVKELISYLYNALMNLEVPIVHYVMHTLYYADLLLCFVETFEEIDRKEYADKFSVVQLLCSLNPDVLPPKRPEMYTPLQLALRSHHDKQFEFIQKIITHNVDVNEPDSRGFTPLHYAVRQKPIPPRVIEIAKLLIENGADPDAVNQQGHTVLHMAPYFLTTEIYDQLILFFDSSGRKDSLKLLTHHNHSLLHLAVVNFDPLPSTLNIFKSNGIDFNGQDNDGDCVVFLAIEGGRNAEFLSTLFEYGADWRVLNKKQENALHVAALLGNVSALKLFIELGCDVNKKNIEHCTPLHNAFLGKRYGEDIVTEHDIVVLLLNEQVDVTAKDTYGKTPIDLAKERLETGKVKQETVQQLLRNKHEAEMESSFIKWVSEIIQRNMDSLITLTCCDSEFLKKFTSSGILTEHDVEELISPGPSNSSSEKRFYTLLLTKKYFLEILLSILQETNQIDALGVLTKYIINTLFDAVMNSKYSFVYYVMETKAYSNIFPLLLQTYGEPDRQEYGKKFRLVQLLCMLNPQLQSHTHPESFTPLQLAILSGHHGNQLELIRMLIKHGADVNERDSGGLTPLHYAVLQMNVPHHLVEIIKLLIENGADTDVGDRKGRTFLHWAPWSLTPELYHHIICLLDSSDKKDSLKLLDSNSFSHLHCAVLKFEPLLETLNIFKSNEIDFNGQDVSGGSSVFVAIAGGRSAEFIVTLFERGADWNIPNNKQENALHVAAFFGNVSAFNLFIALGVDVNARNTLRRSPLHNAFLGEKDGEDIMTEHDIVVLLLNEQVDVTAKDTHGKTPIDLAKERLKTGKVNQETVEVLEKYSSK